MKVIQQLGLKQKFVGAAFLLFLITGIFVSIFFPLRQKQQMGVYMQEKALTIAQMAAYSSSAGLLFEDQSSVEEALKSLSKSKDVEFGAVVNEDGEIFAKYLSERADEDHLEEHVNEALDMEDEVESHKDALLVRVPVLSASEQIGTLVLAVYLKDFLDDIAQSRLIAFIVGLSILIVGCGVFYLLADRIVAVINKSINVISTSSSEIAATIRQHERIASAQLSAVTETATTMEELGVSAQQSADQTESASRSAEQVMQLAEQGASSINNAQKSMKVLKEKVEGIAEQILHLSDQVSQISDVTAIVSDISNQVNLLALNASVEAARAGEHGKGFAVVATEIRKLADQTKKSADKINLLVNDIQKATNSTVMVTEEGTKNVDQVADISSQNAQSFSRISQSVSEVSQNIQQITLNVQQQAAAISQVVEAMNSINTGAKETVSGVSQMKEGIERLNETTNKLTAMI